MSYASAQDMIDRYRLDELVELTDSARIGVVDTQVLGQALADADAEINGYLATRYALPLATVPVSIRRLACDMARYFLHDDHAPEQVGQRYRDAVRFLKSVSDGTVSLGLDAANQVAVAASGGAQYTAPTRVFDQSTLVDY